MKPNALQSFYIFTFRPILAYPIHPFTLCQILVTSSSGGRFFNSNQNDLLTLLMESSWHREAHTNASKKMEISQVKSFLDEHYKEKLSLESVASHFFIDKHYLARLFKEQYGVTLVTYLQQVRITHAKRMLRFTDKSIEEIGLECGIGELNYFSRVFKKLEGVSPSEFRRVW